MADVHEFVESAAFPVVVKAAESWLLPSEARTKPPFGVVPTNEAILVSTPLEVTRKIAWSAAP